MKSRRTEAKSTKVEDRKKASTSKQQLSLWRSVRNFVKAIPRALGIRSTRSAKSAGGRAEQSASRLTNPQSKRGRRPAAPVSKYPNLQGPRLIDRVLKDLSGNSRKPPAGGSRTSKLSRNSAKRNRTAPNSIHSGKRSGIPPSTKSKIGPKTVLKERTARPFSAKNPRVQKHEGSPSNQSNGPRAKPGKRPQKQNEGSSFWKFLQQSVSRFFPPAGPIMGFAASLIPGGKGQRDSFGNKGQRPDQGPPSQMQDANGTTTESSDLDTQSDHQQFDEPATGQSGGWPTSTHSITDARFNNVPKRPLQPIR
ncbi:MAG: hypothetical protein JWP89_3693 [Schlesneria sp.]|nr:hypothetical protein [Schlesneria sp.]